MEKINSDKLVSNFNKWFRISLGTVSSTGDATENAILSKEVTIEYSEH